MPGPTPPRRPPVPAGAAALAALALLAAVPAHGQLLWYGGDGGDAGWYNNTRLPPVVFGSSALDDFVVTDPAGWLVTGVFSNDLAGYPIGGAPISQALWSIRTGAGDGNFGTVLFGGLGPVTPTPTGRTFGGDVEYTVAVSGLSVYLAPGVYYLSVSPVAADQRYYVGVSNGANAVGAAGPGPLLWEDHFVLDGTPVDRISAQGGSSTFSMGVVGTVVPEPGTGVLTGGALAAVLVVGSVRRRR